MDTVETIAELKAYQRWARGIAVHPDSGSGSATEIGYLALGLVGEIAEALEKETGLAGTAAIQAELGDTLWYLVRLLDALGLPLEQSGLAGDGDAGKPNVYLGDLVAAAGLICDNAKKLLRDGKPDELGATTADRMRVIGRLFVAVARHHSTSPVQLALANIAKLEIRRAKGTLQGEGDAR